MQADLLGAEPAFDAAGKIGDLHAEALSLQVFVAPCMLNVTCHVCNVMYAIDRVMAFQSVQFGVTCQIALPVTAAVLVASI